MIWAEVSSLRYQSAGRWDLRAQDFCIGESPYEIGTRCCHRKSINTGTLAASLAQQILGERCFMNSPSFLSRGRILHKSVATMGNFSALTLISDECFHNKSNLDLPAVDGVAAKLLPPRSYSTRQAIINELELQLKKVMSRYCC
ncbi:hypothetical protein OIU79_014901 [Salix purpurea]|uniref:Uncharacterized protein n=1 Tax=Salix purpurea TaxID=77065 RepID=A0A9Q0SPI9_SALPP|nr:hypothetical protein OIU79_014901 [Salix purpurea]